MIKVMGLPFPWNSYFYAGTSAFGKLTRKWFGQSGPRRSGYEDSQPESSGRKSKRLSGFIREKPRRRIQKTSGSMAKKEIPVQIPLPRRIAEALSRSPGLNPKVTNIFNKYLSVWNGLATFRLFSSWPCWPFLDQVNGEVSTFELGKHS